jgi:Predicted hydrolase (HAD superfamily)
LAGLPRFGRRLEAPAQALPPGGDDQCPALGAGSDGATLGDPFDDGVTVDEAGCEKPDPAFFAFTRGRLSVLGHGLADILHVAQSQYHDIGVARRLGYKVCWIERRRGLKGFGGTQDPGQVTTPDYHFATLGELADAVEAG